MGSDQKDTTLWLNYKWMKKQEDRLSAEVNDRFRRAAEADQAEDEEFGEDRRGDGPLSYQPLAATSPY